MQPRMGGDCPRIIFRDVETLFASYMPYVVGGGLLLTIKATCENG